MINDSFEIKLDQFHDFDEYVFNEKRKNLSNFISENSSINLILGSSMMEDAMIPDTMDEKWFSFCVARQNIYESYKFLKYYKNLIKIDSIIIGIQAFDFPSSYLKHRKKNNPQINGSFYIFGIDSIIKEPEISLKKTIQVFKNQLLFDINDIFTGKIFNKRKLDVWTKQGFSGRINLIPVDLDLK